MEIKITKNMVGYTANITSRINQYKINFDCNIIKNKLFVNLYDPINIRYVDHLIEPINTLFNNKYKIDKTNFKFDHPNSLSNPTPPPLNTIKLRSQTKNNTLFNDITIDNEVIPQRKRKLSYSHDEEQEQEQEQNSRPKRSCVESNNRYLGASNTKYFYGNDILGYNLKLLKINTINNFIDFTCSTTDDDYMHYNDTPTYSGEETRIYPKNKILPSSNEIVGYMFEKGIQFEKYICNKLRLLCDKYKLSFLCIVEGKPIYEKYNEYLLNTKNGMKNGVDIIYQGMIQTSDKSKYKFRGFPDLMVSKRAFKLLFYNFMDRSDNLNISLDIELNNKINNYIVIDIKSSTIQLNADGKTARNMGLLKYYKSQLATYGYIMNEQTPNKQTLTYILPYCLKMDYVIDKKRYDHIITNPYNSKYCLVNIDIDNKDNDYYLNLNNIYDDYLKCLNKYEDCIKSNYSFLFDEQVKELNDMYSNDDYINLEKVKKCNKLLSINMKSFNKQNLLNFDIPFVRSNFGISERLSIKYWIAKQTRSLSLLRGFNNTELIKLKEQGIYSYLQTDKIINYLDNRLEKKNDVNLIKSIVYANSESNTDNIYCENINDKLNEFNSKLLNNKIICCLDFETIPLKLITNKDLIHDYDNIDNIDNNYNVDNGQKIFMIGCNFFKNIDGKFVNIKNYQLSLNKIYENGSIIDIDDDIYQLFCDLEKTINSVKSINKIKKEMAFVIWSPFEISVMKQFNKLNLYGRSKFQCDKDNNALLFNIKIIDLMKIFSDNKNPIGVRGAFDCSIKSIANGLHNNGLIHNSQIWNSDNIVNGLDAMYYALWYYSDKNNEKYKSIFEKIKSYNMTDCSIMAHIINATYSVLNK